MWQGPLRWFRHCCELGKDFILYLNGKKGVTTKDFRLHCTMDQSLIMMLSSIWACTYLCHRRQTWLVTSDMNPLLSEVSTSNPQSHTLWLLDSDVEVYTWCNSQQNLCWSDFLVSLPNVWIHSMEESQPDMGYYWPLHYPVLEISHFCQ